MNLQHTGPWSSSNSICFELSERDLELARQVGYPASRILSDLLLPFSERDNIKRVIGFSVRNLKSRG